MQIRKFSIMFLCLVFFQVVGIAQTTKTISVEMSYDDNAFRNYYGLSDYVTQLNLYLAKDYGGEQLAARSFYASTLNFFAEYTERFSHYHRIGFALSRSIGDNGAALNAGGNLAIRRYDSGYNYTNFIQGSGYVNFKIRPKESIIGQVGYIIRYRNYEKLPEFTNTEHQLFSRLSLFLPSKTSVILYGRYGIKSYQSQMVTTVIEDTLGTMGGRGRGPSMGDGTYTIYSQVQAPSSGQFIGSIKVGQSLTSSTGLSAQYLRRVNLTNSSRYSVVAGEVWAYSGEDDLFDDPYGYEGHEVSFALTQMMPWYTTLKLGFDLYIKHYSAEALDLDGLLLADNRHDDRNLLWASLSKRFSRTSAFRNLTLNIDFYYLENDSNDPYFTYTNNVLAFGTGFSF